NHAPILFRLWLAVLSGLFVMVPLTFATIYAERSIQGSVDTMIYGSVTQAEVAANRLKWFGFIPLKEYNRLALAYGREWDIHKKAVLGRTYWELTGEDIDLRQRMLSD
ncbi:MAG TPA: hypothetical protein VGD38_01525, partial [Pyrinomonadaceae bacterium]